MAAARSIYKPKNTKKTLGQIARDLKHQWHLILIIVLVIAASAIISVFTPSILQNALENIVNFNKDIGILEGNNYILLIQLDGTVLVNWMYVLTTFGLIILLFAVVAFLNWLSDFIIVKIVSTYAYDLRNKMQEKINRLPLKYFDGTTYGEVLSRCINDVEVIIQNFNSIISQTVSGVFTLVTVLIVMFVKSWELSLVAMAQLPLLIILVVIVAKYSQKQFIKYRVKLGSLTSLAEESYSGYTIIKLFNMEKEFEENFDGINKDMAKSDRWSQWLSSFIFPGMRFISNLGFVGVCLVAALILKDNPINAMAMIVAFLIYLNTFSQPFQQVGQISNAFQMTIVAFERIYELLDQEEEVPDADNAITSEEGITGHVQINAVDFSYDKNIPLITDMNLEVNVGEMVAIVGPTGAGKTTIVNLLMRFYDVDQGSIMLDGIDIRNYSRQTLRDVFGMVLQDTWLFKGTIRENILFGQDGATEEEMIEASTRANAHHFIKTLPNGYDFELNEDGTNISLGQRQLITIARAIISRPKILILDEATSSVDTRTEFMIQEATKDLMKGKTSFVIAHRLSTIKNAKTILVMNKGKIIEKGNHKELMEKQGFYFDLYNSQYLNTNAEDEDETNS